MHVVVRRFRRWFCFSLFLLIVGNSKHASSFIVRVYQEKMHVISPKHFSSDVSVIIDNRTGNSLRGKIQVLEQGISHAINVKPGKTFSQYLPVVEKKSQIVFFPLAPPREKIYFTFGRGPYDIPPKKHQH